MWRHYTDSWAMSVIPVRPVDFARRVRCDGRPKGVTRIDGILASLPCVYKLSPLHRGKRLVCI